MNIKFEHLKPTRREAYNFKSSEGQKYFKEITSDTKRLSSCFLSNEPFQKQLKIWEHEVKSHIIKAFPKIRSKKRKFSDTNTGKLLEERKKIRLFNNHDPSEENSLKLATIEAKISERIAERYRTEIHNTMGHLTAEDGGVSHHGIWKAKNAIVPNDKKISPAAMKDKKGNLITSPEGIMKMSMEEILERLRHREIRPDLVELKILKEDLCRRRIDIIKHIKTSPWTMEELDKVLNSLQNKKCRDPQGFINELLKHASAGSDLKESILYILNKTKDSLEIPEIMTNVNIVMIPKPGKKVYMTYKTKGEYFYSVFSGQ